MQRRRCGHPPGPLECRRRLTTPGGKTGLLLQIELAGPGPNGSISLRGWFRSFLVVGRVGGGP